MPDRNRVIYPPDPNPRAPRFRPPPRACDTHFHLYGPPHRFPYVDERLYTPPAAPLEHYLALMEFLGLERGILVHPSVHGNDNWITLDALRRSDGRLRGMARSTTALEPADVRLLHDAGVRGVRFNLVEELGGAFDAAAYDRVVSAVAARGWVICVHAPGGALESLAEKLIRTPANVVIDHFGRVDGREGVAGKDFHVLLDLVAEKNVWCKISGADRLMQRGASYANIPPMARALIERAPDRIVWGTDWPHSNVFAPGKMANDGDLLNMLMDFAPDEAVRARILADNPAALFDFG